MVCFPPSKINLGLQVVARRPDGYHEVNTCYFPVPLTDILEVITADEFSFSSTGLPIAGGVSDNLCVKAFELVRDQFDVGPVKIHLHKCIPMGAGLGGGSSNGAWTLKLLDALFGLGLSDEQLKGLAGKLGSDCAFFLSDGPQLGQGRGEVLTPVSIDLSGYFLVIVKPDVHVATSEAYGMIRPRRAIHDLHDVISRRPVDTWTACVVNDFEAPVFERFPEIARVKERLISRGATYAAMSGSGSAVFGLFRKPVNLAGEFDGHFYFESLL